MFRSLAALAASIVGIHAAYLGWVRPQAERSIEAAMEAGMATPRNLWIVLKDYEQEICLVLMVWGLFLIFDKYRTILRQQYLFDTDLLEDTDVSGDPARAVRSFEELGRQRPDVWRTPLVQTLAAGLRRFAVQRDVQNASEAIEAGVDALAAQQEAENSLIRYLIWAIPSIGFIGTVRGIGRALSQADQALAGDIFAMTESLGLAFNSTLVALLISIVLMFFLHQLQRLQDGLVIDTRRYCDEVLVGRISALPAPDPDGTG
ncbi:MAG: MotA/TolQ/ExbB proton channel family protein [Proteobacteria bacterium]|nr:MotA/TolQ/ExbB proton channel family protein [Pseudomonadota bacterium]